MENGAGETTQGPGRSAPRHPIGVVAARTGLTQDVLRIWERRYGAVEPARTETGQRLYSDADVERLQLLQRGTSAGRSIGQLVRLAEDELRALVREDEAAAPPLRADLAGQAAPADAAANIETALEHVVRLDAAGLESLLRRQAALWGMASFLESLAAPLFRRIGDEWHDGRLSPAQEHLATAVMRGVLQAVAAELAPSAAAPQLLVATPAAERHEIGALLVAATAAAAGWGVTYLGPDLPARDIAAAAGDTGARAVAMSLVFSADEAAVVAELLLLRRLLPGTVTVLVGGRGAAPLAAALDAPGIRVLAGLPELRNWLRRPT
jgi:MerR family transcriptional regulator, light-induced transcriptional regulator